jgi:ketosteroid isomerase-like protein
MSEIENKELARRWQDEQWNKKNYDIVDELLSPSLGIEEHKAWMRAMHAATDIQMTVLDAIGEGDQVVLHWTSTGIPRDDTPDTPAGKPFTMRGLTLLRFADGKIVEDASYWEDSRSPLVGDKSSY